MKPLRNLIGFMGPILVVGALVAFAGYALFLYQPNEEASCQKTGVAQQIDIAIHTLRQWFGKEGQLYLTCGGE